MSKISPSSIRVTKTLQERIDACQSQSEITMVLREEALKQRVVEKDWDESILNPTKFSETVGKTVVIDGISHEIIGATEADVLAQESALYRAALQPVAASTEQPRDTAGRFVAQEQTPEEIAADAAAATAETARQANLTFQMRLGNLSVGEYLEQSGAIEKHIAQRDQQVLISGWASATEEFLHSDEAANGRALRRPCSVSENCWLRMVWRTPQTKRRP